ncbi:DsbC family protein [Sulfuriflexus mobilis]|uniref:DsbC family protein n=1 Tax=Sulfuriflexus mobilis TaxID=1811807 RepID=UPI000F8451B9|nr:DsbC family protein [Sulfuriflexus mobilis]
MKFILFTSLAMLMTVITPVSADDRAAIRKSLAEVMPGETQYSISDMPIKGIYEVDFGDGFIYLSADGRYAIKGEIIDLQKNINLTEQKRAEARLGALAGISREEMLIYPADKGKKYSITVFTDIDCGYCRRLHQEMKAYTSRGIEVKYAFYPRAGRVSASFDKAVSVWCADDRHAAMDAAKSGKAIENKQCPNPVGKHMDAAAVLGVAGTPTIFTQDGQRLPGYVPAAQLEQMLNKQVARQ